MCYAAPLYQVNFFSFNGFFSQFYILTFIYIFRLRVSYLLFYYVHIQRLLKPHYYRLLRMSTFRLNRRDLIC